MAALASRQLVIRVESSVEDIIKYLNLTREGRLSSLAAAIDRRLQVQVSIVNVKKWRAMAILSESVPHRVMKALVFVEAREIVEREISRSVITSFERAQGESWLRDLKNLDYTLPPIVPDTHAPKTPSVLYAELVAECWLIGDEFGSWDEFSAMPPAMILISLDKLQKGDVKARHVLRARNLSSLVSPPLPVLPATTALP